MGGGGYCHRGSRFPHHEVQGRVYETFLGLLFLIGSWPCFCWYNFKYAHAAPQSQFTLINFQWLLFNSQEWVIYQSVFYVSGASSCPDSGTRSSSNLKIESKAAYKRESFRVRHKLKKTLFARHRHDIEPLRVRHGLISTLNSCSPSWLCLRMWPMSKASDKTALTRRLRQTPLSFRCGQTSGYRNLYYPVSHTLTLL